MIGAMDQLPSTEAAVNALRATAAERGAEQGGAAGSGAGG